MKTHAVSDTVRVCSHCAEIKSLDQFRRRYRNRFDRLHQCNACHAATERSRRANRRRIQRGLQIQKFATAICKTRNHKQRQLVWQMGVSAAGGFGRFLETWHDVISTMIAQRQYSPRLLRLYELIWEIHREEEKRRVTELGDMSDHDLEAVVRSQITQLIQEEPQVAIDAARQLGWTVVPNAA